MTSRFKQSLGLFKILQFENVYRTKNEEEFDYKYVGKPTNLESYIKQLKEEYYKQNIEDYYKQEADFQYSHRLEFFYENMYAAFRFAYELDIILAQIECDEVNLSNAESLMQLFNMLKVESSNVMMYIDDDFSLSKKYNLCEDISAMIKNLYDMMCLYHIWENDEKLTKGKLIKGTKYDEIEMRLSCKYIRRGLSVMKVFHILAVLYISPLYSDEVHHISKKMIKSLWEVLYNKRIIKLIIDSNLYGNNNKMHKSTRLKIYFAMANSDRYCIRLDFPHEGEDSIHLNMNQPEIKQSTGFPFSVVDYNNLKSIWGQHPIIDSLFYKLDDLYWFRSDFSSKIKDIGEEKETLKKQLEIFSHDRAHISISSSDYESRNGVISFSAAFAEAMIDYELAPNIYGDTDMEDRDLYQYVLFEDYIYDIIIKIKQYKLESDLKAGEHRYVVQKDIDKMELELHDMICNYIRTRFQNDKKLLECAEKDIDFCDFIIECLEYIDEACY